MTHYYTASEGFLGLSAQQAVAYDDARAVIIPFGLEASVSYGGGTAQGAQAMIKASHQVELFDEQFWCQPVDEIGVITAKAPDVDDNIAKALQQLEGMVERVLSDHKFPFVFGGEHSITAGAIRPFVRRYENIVILHFDAHADLRNGYEGEHYSHAAALRRCLDHPQVELLSLGIRNISAEEIPYLESNRHRIHIYWAKDKANWDIAALIKRLVGRSVYVTFDLDAFDASLMPATGTPEPGGLFWHDVMRILTAVSPHCRIVGADINELAPIPQLHGCDFIAAKLAYKILTFAFLANRDR